MSGAVHSSALAPRVVLLEIDHPPANTLSRAMRARLLDRFDAIEGDPETRSVVLSGRGGGFCGGADLREELRSTHEATPERAPAADLADFDHLFQRIEGLRVPVIAAIHGWCVGGGLELALACDVRFASAEAHFVCAGVNVGLMASAYRLPRLIGEARAKHMLLTGLPHDAATAERFGLVTRVCAHGQLLPEVTAFASRIASRAPLSVEATKRFVNRACGLDRDEASRMQAAELEALSRSDDHRIALEAFLGKKTPSFTGT